MTFSTKWTGRKNCKFAKLANLPAYSLFSVMVTHIWYIYIGSALIFFPGCANQVLCTEDSDCWLRSCQDKKAVAERLQTLRHYYHRGLANCGKSRLCAAGIRLPQPSCSYRLLVRQCIAFLGGGKYGCCSDPCMKKHEYSLEAFRTN